MSKYILIILIVIYTCLDIQSVRLDTSSENPKIINNTINSGSLSNNDLPKIKNSINQEKKPIPPELTNKVQENNENSVLNSNDVNKVVKNNTPTEKSVQKKPQTTVVDQIQQPKISLTTDTFIRGFYVCVGFGIVIVVYLGIKTVRVNQLPTPETTVRKYGIKAKRGDLEMLPLPLVEDEDDDTLFDVGNHVRTGN